MLHIYVCVCVRMSACAQASGRIVTSFVAPLALPKFSSLCHKRQDFRKKETTEHKIRVFIFSTTYVIKHFSL